jgi:hypothetical protein
MTNLNYTDLFKELICEFAHERVTVFRVAVNEVDKGTAVGVLRISMKLVNESVARPYLWPLPHKRSSYASAASTH